ncbi:MAG: hypothetical protein DRQ44_15010, partial [Gammaproteobacteria bacterium]
TKAMTIAGIRIAHMDGLFGQASNVINNVHNSVQYAQGIDIIRAIQRMDSSSGVSIELFVIMTISCHLNDLFPCS